MSAAVRSSRQAITKVTPDGLPTMHSFVHFGTASHSNRLAHLLPLVADGFVFFDRAPAFENGGVRPKPWRCSLAMDR
jgi:hypothetical protein